MKLIIEKNEQAMSESAMQIILGAMMQDKKVNISLTSGTSPITMYKMMVPYVKDKPQFKDVDYYLFDEAPEVGEVYTCLGLPNKGNHGIDEGAAALLDFVKNGKKDI